MQLLIQQLLFSREKPLNKASLSNLPLLILTDRAFVKKFERPVQFVYNKPKQIKKVRLTDAQAQAYYLICNKEQFHKLIDTANLPTQCLQELFEQIDKQLT
jgi:hypothetical protein